MSNQSPADVALDGLHKGEEGFEIFYKYQSINEYSLDALRNGYCYFSSYSQLNDPFDPFITMVASSSEEDLVRVFLEKGPKVFCMTPDCNSPTMWGHYGDSSRGMCIGYAVFTGTPSLVQQVQYVSELPKNIHIGSLFTIKHEAWSMEQEWRAILATDDQKIDKLFHPVSIFLGPKASHEDMVKVKEAMPSSIQNFEIKYPNVANGQFVYQDYDIEELLKHYSELPKLEHLLGNRN